MLIEILSSVIPMCFAYRLGNVCLLISSLLIQCDHNCAPNDESRRDKQRGEEDEEEEKSVAHISSSILR